MIQKLAAALRPYFSVLAVAFALSLIWSWSSGYKDAVTWGAFAYVLYDAVRRREKLFCGGIGWPLLAFLIICGISAFTSVTPRDSRSAYLKLLELAAGCVALTNLLRPDNRAVTATRVVAFAMLALVAIDTVRLGLDLRTHTNFLTDERWRGSHYGFPTIAAAVIASGFVLIAALLLNTKKIATRGACVVGLGLCAVLFSHFQTRSVFLGLGCGLVVLLFATIKERKIALAAVGLCALVLAGAMFGAPKLRERVLSGSSSGRDEIWADARFQIGQQIPKYHRFFGYGYGHGVLKETYKMTSRKNIRAKVRLDHTHNMMLEITLQTGWFGLAAWLWLLGAAFVRAARSLWTATGERRWAIGALAAGLVALIAYGQFSAFFALAPHFLFWNLLGLLLATCSPPTPEKIQAQEKSVP